MTFAPGGSTTTMTGVVSDAANLLIDYPPCSGFTVPSLTLTLSSGTGNSETVTFSFSQPIQNLSFTIGEIDSAADYRARSA